MSSQELLHCLQRNLLLDSALQNRLKILFANADESVVVEELESFLENIMKQIAFEEGYSKELTIHGKDIFPQNGEFSGEIYLENIARLIGLSYKKVNVPVATTFRIVKTLFK